MQPFQYIAQLATTAAAVICLTRTSTKAQRKRLCTWKVFNYDMIRCDTRQCNTLWYQWLKCFFLIPANATTPFAGNNSMENITQTTLSIEMIEGVDMIPVLQPTALRTNPLYSIYFNWFRFIAIGIIPFALLVRIYLFIVICRFFSFKLFLYQNKRIYHLTTCMLLWYCCCINQSIFFWHANVSTYVPM